MAKTVYIFGAGINQTISNQDGLHPPLATNFFQTALKHHSTGTPDYRGRLKPAFEYIQRYWHMSIADLEVQPFDLEACFTLIQQQLLEVKQEEKRRELVEIYFRLTLALAEVLDDFEHHFYTSEAFRALGQMILSENAAVLSFNYDTLIESAIESASGAGRYPSSFLNPANLRGNEISDEELSCSHFKWNRPLAYGVRFDEVRLHRAGVSAHVSGERFYGHAGNELYPVPVLKLHGSLNWFRQTDQRKYPLHPDFKMENKNAGKTVVTNATWMRNEIPDLNGWLLEPLLITPQLYKDLSFPIIKAVWQRAYHELKECTRLIVGGYSFPVTDFAIRKLFLEAFQNHVPETLIVINPDPNVIQIVKTHCHYEKDIVICNELTEFVERFSKGADFS